MCGVVGAIGLDPNEGVARRALLSLHHRGPDGPGDRRFRLGHVPVWLGHTRLPILDLSQAGAQPMSSHCGRWVISFNGEIYNLLELRNELQCAWRGHSDTETLVEAIAAWGIDRTLVRLNGIFAFAAFDTCARKAFLARDPFGVKPIYYRQSGKELLFASEIVGIRALCGERNRIDRESLQTLLALRFVPSPHTLFEGIHRVTPGHVIRVDVSDWSVVETPYVEPQATTFVGTMDDAVEGFLERLQNAIKRQLLSDVPVGLLLSGGIDSALIAACVKRIGFEMPTYTVGYGNGQPECEIHDALATARAFGFQHHAVTVDPESLWETLPLASASIEEPLGTTSVLPMWHLTKRARQDVSVVLTGQGSDEPWGGYRRYQLEIMRAVFPLVSGARAMRLAMPLLNLPEHMARSLHSLAIDDVAGRFLAAYELFSPAQREALTQRGDDGGARVAIERWLAWPGTTSRPMAMKMIHIDARFWLADDLLLYGDKISMAFSQEARVPFLDHELMAFVESLPLSYRAGFRKTKIALRRAAGKLLPHSIIERPKKRFEMPFAQWARGVWRTRIEDLLLSPGSPHLAFLDRSGIQRVLGLHCDQRVDMSRQIFSLMMLALWWRHQDVSE